MRTLLLAALVLAALVGGLLLLKSTGSDPAASDAGALRHDVPFAAGDEATSPLAGVDVPTDAGRTKAAPELVAVPDAERAVANAGGSAAAPRRGRVRGTVTDRAGRPIAGADLVARRSDALWMLGEVAEPAGAAKDVTDAKGEFALECAAGDVTLTVGADGFAPLEQALDVPSTGTCDAGELRLAEGVILRGRVVDASGAGVADVVLRRAPRAVGAMTVTRLGGGEVAATTDEGGRFAIERQDVGPYRFAVAHPEYPNAEFSGTTRAAGEVQDGLVIALRPGATITGLVTGIPAPAPGAARPALVVQAAPAGSGDIDVIELGASRIRTGEVQDDGSFTITGVEPGVAVTLAVHEGARRWDGSSRRSEELGATAGESGVRIAFSRGATLAFRVTDAAGTPIEPDRVSVGTDYPMPREPERIDASLGAYRLEGLWPPRDGSRPRVVLAASGFEALTVDDLELRTGAVLDLGTLVMRSRPQVRVTVLAEGTRTPVVDASVVLRPAPEPGPRTERMGFSMSLSLDSDDDPPEVSDPFGREVRGSTDEQGICRLDATPGETVIVEVAHPEHAFARVEPFEVASGVAETPIEVVLGAGGAVDVTVVDTVGQPGSSYEVLVRGRSDGPAATTDEVGTVTLTGLASGEQWLRLGERRTGDYMVFDGFGMDGGPDDEAFEWTRVEVVAGETVSATLIAPARGSIVGTVTELSVPLAGATVSIRDPDGGESLGGLILGGGSAAATADARGEFVIDDLEEGDHELVIEHPTRAMGTRWPITVEPGTNRVEIDLSVTRVEGRVLDPAGEPVVGATVEAKRHQPSGGRRMMAAMIVTGDEGGGGMVMSVGGEAAESVRTDAEGRFTLRGVAAGTPIVVVARADGFDEARSEPFEVGLGAVEDGLELRFQVTGALRIEIEDFRPGLMAVLRRRGEVGGEPKIQMLSAESTTVDGLGPGRWTVTVRGMGPGNSVSVDPDEVVVDIVGGETATAAFVLR